MLHVNVLEHEIEHINFDENHLITFSVSSSVRQSVHWYNNLSPEVWSIYLYCGESGSISCLSLHADLGQYGYKNTVLGHFSDFAGCSCHCRK